MSGYVAESLPVVDRTPEENDALGKAGVTMMAVLQTVAPEDRVEVACNVLGLVASQEGVRWDTVAATAAEFAREHALMKSSHASRDTSENLVDMPTTTTTPH